MHVCLDHDIDTIFDGIGRLYIYPLLYIVFGDSEFSIEKEKSYQCDTRITDSKSHLCPEEYISMIETLLSIKSLFFTIGVDTYDTSMGKESRESMFYFLDSDSHRFYIHPLTRRTLEWHRGAVITVMTEQKSPSLCMIGVRDITVWAFPVVSTIVTDERPSKSTTVKIQEYFFFHCEAVFYCLREFIGNVRSIKLGVCAIDDRESWTLHTLPI